MIWAELVGSKPSSYFQTADGPLLARFCVLAARAEEIEQALASTPVQSEEAGRLERRALAVAAGLGGLAQKLRLTVASRVGRHSPARSAEVKGWVGKPWEELIGGHAVRRPSRQ
jgi:hypothetical protein